MVEAILGIPSSRYWSVADSVGPLRLIHYNTDLIPYLSSDPDVDNLTRVTIYSLRGTIIDMNIGKIVCQSYGYTPNIISDTLPEIKDITYRRSYAGTVLRVWQHPVTLDIYMSSYKKIDTSRSRWHQSRPFTEIFTSLFKSDPRTLFQ